MLQPTTFLPFIWDALVTYVSLDRAIADNFLTRDLVIELMLIASCFCCCKLLHLKRWTFYDLGVLVMDACDTTGQKTKPEVIQALLL
jgi:hypothetical protein